MLTRVFDILLNVLAGITIGFALCLFLLFRLSLAYPTSESGREWLRQHTKGLETATPPRAQSDPAVPSLGYPRTSAID